MNESVFSDNPLIFVLQVLVAIIAVGFAYGEYRLRSLWNAA